MEVEVLREITNRVRSGNLIATSKAKASAGKVIRAYKPKKVVHVGHSFGSVTTAGMLSQYGHLSDGALLTGFIPGSKLGVARFSEFGYEYAPEHDARRFGDRSSGYVVQATKTNIQQIFLKKGSFEPELLRYAEAIKQTASVGEMLSGGAFVGHAAPSFSGPVQVGNAVQPSNYCDFVCQVANSDRKSSSWANTMCLFARETAKTRTTWRC